MDKQTQEMVQIRTYEFNKGFLHLELAAVKDMSTEEIEEMYGTVLSVQDGEMPADEFFDLPDYRDI